MRILITGVTGFVGRNLYRGLSHEKKNTIYVVTRREIGCKNQIFWDMTKPMPIDLFPKKIDVIIHAAQSLRYKEFPEGCEDMLLVNVQSTAALLNYAVQAKASQFILLSTGSVYEPYPGPCFENAKVSPTGFYPASKYASEILANIYYSLFKVCIFRLFFPYGAGQTNRIIPELIKKIRHYIPIKLAGKAGGTHLTPLYIDNLVEIVIQAINKEWHGIINLASPKMYSIQQISTILAKIMNLPVQFDVQSNEEPLFIQPGLERLNLLYPNFDFISLKEGLIRMLEKDMDLTLSSGVIQM